MTEDNKTQRFLEMMALMEHLDEYIDHCNSVRQIPFENVNQEIWTIVQNELIPGLTQIVELYKNTIQSSAKILDNDAAYAHIRTVIEAD